MKEIARILKIKPRTVAFHKYALMRELGITSNAELVRYGVKQGLVSQ
jgi:DNA-binding CsgD family transcriptional regulator